MGQVRHGSATTTHAIRAAIQRSQASLSELSQVERMNRTIKEGEAEQKTIRGIVFPLNVKRFHYDSHDQLRTHLTDFMAAYNFARRLKTLGGLTPYEYICKVWTSEPDRFILDPIHQMPGLNT